MLLSPRLVLTSEARRQLVDVAAGRAPADLLLRGGRVLNVYTGELVETAVGIAAGRIAWVGPETDRAARQVLELDGGTAVPGLIEPHCHPDVLYTPSALGAAIVSHGTTTACADTAFLSLSLDDDALVEVLRGMERATVKFLWNLRNCLDGVLPQEVDLLQADRMVRLLDRVPGVVATGEMTAWPRLVDHDARLRRFLDAAVERGLRIDGHAAGASPRTLGLIAAAGITADHEAISAEELLARLRLGYWIMLRHSSLRPDGPELAAGLREAGVATARVMLTTDGPVAADVVGEHLDGVVRRLIAAGFSPVEAVRMATLNPATYLGLDAHLGGIAPGRCADLVVVDSLETFVPMMVLADGVPVSASSVTRGFTGWRELPARPLGQAELDEGRLADACQAGPVLQLQGIITRQVSGRHAADGRSGDAACLALVGRSGEWIAGATLLGLDIRALASSYTGSGDVLLVGRDPRSLVASYRRVVELGGGLVTPDHEVPLRVLGGLYEGSVGELAAELGRLTAGVRLTAPLEYLCLFASLAVLPDVRLSPQGVVQVKTGRVLAPVRPLAVRTTRS